MSKVFIFDVDGTLTPSRQKIFPGELSETQTDPENIMPAFLFLIGPDSRHVNGQKLHAQID